MTAVADIVISELARMDYEIQPKPAYNVGQAMHRPNTPYDAQRDQNDMVYAMRPRTYSWEERQAQIKRYNDALQYMRAQDAARVRRFTNLKSPFPKAA